MWVQEVRMEGKATSEGTVERARTLSQPKDYHNRSNNGWRNIHWMRPSIEGVGGTLPAGITHPDSSQSLELLKCFVYKVESVLWRGSGSSYAYQRRKQPGFSQAFRCHPTS
jgi:hypothetical protein